MVTCARHAHGGLPQGLREKRTKREPTDELLPDSRSTGGGELFSVLRFTYNMPRDPGTELHRAAEAGSTERTVELLSTGSINVDRQSVPGGMTPLMVAANKGYLRLARILLNNGANMSMKDDHGATALHFSAEGGHLALTKMLTREGADPHSVTEAEGRTPLHAAAEEGHSEVISTLLDAGADPDSRTKDGQTPLFAAMMKGHVDATRALLRAKADPSLGWTAKSNNTYSPLDIAVFEGHTDVVREVVKQVGIKGCGGKNGGGEALYAAAQSEKLLGVMAILSDAGVVDRKGACLVAAAREGNQVGVKFLLQQEANFPRFQHPRRTTYVNARECGTTALVACIERCHPCSPRMIQLLVEAGADTTSRVLKESRILDESFCGTPLALATKYHDEKTVDDEPVTKEQLNSLEAIRRLLLRVEAVHATSLLWPSEVPVAVQAMEGTVSSRTTSTPLRRMLPNLRRRATRRVVLSAQPSRWKST